ncbi:histidinol dehydrogenase [Bacillus cereus]
MRRFNGLKLSNEIAPEHLELHEPECSSLCETCRIYLSWTICTEPLGDYLAGPNHVLPTSGTARFFSPLSVDDFVKKSSFLSYTEEALRDVQHHIVELANKEGLHAHARAIQIRFEEEE